MFTSSAYLGPKEIHYLFVDGGALRGRIKNLSTKYFNGAQFNINFQAIVQNFTKVFYYDALPVRERNELEDVYEARIKPNRAVFDSAADIDRVHVYQGDLRSRQNGRRIEQKKVDVMLTVDMLTHSFRRNMHQATLLTGDNDFKPLIDALVQDGMFVTLWYPPQETSRELMRAADARRSLDISTLHSFLTPDSQKLFQIPQVMNMHPSVVLPNSQLTSWRENSKLHALFLDGEEYLVTKEGNELNRLHVRHANIELLRTFCLESLNITIPVIP